jgi:hypothetical protein
MLDSNLPSKYKRLNESLIWIGISENLSYFVLMKCICFLFLTLVTLEACKKTNSTPIPPPPPEPDIFIGGSLTLPNGYGYGVTWKNGLATVVPDSSVPISLSYTVNDLYALGSSGVYSRDGMQPAQQCPAGGSNIAALGTDVYITCRNSSDNAALYWKNGQFIYLTMIGGLINHAMSTNILISGTDIYVAGTVNEYPDYVDKAVYWKNGVINYLPDGYSAESIAVSGNNVYVTGNSNNRAAYWINGQLHVLGQYDAVSGIVVSGTDVYMADTWPENPCWEMRRDKRSSIKTTRKSYCQTERVLMVSE